MAHKKKSNQFLELMTDAGRKVVRQIGWMIFLGLSLNIFDTYYLKSICQNGGKSNPIQCSASPLVGNLGMELFQIAITIWFLDIGLKRETLQEMHKIFNATEAAKHIKSFHLKQEEYDGLIKDNFNQTKSQ